MFQTTRDYLASYITCTGSATIINILLLLLTAAMAVLGYYIVKRLLEIVERIILHSPTDWDDDLIDMRLLKAISQLAPAIIVRWVLPGFFGSDPTSFHWLSAVTSLYIVWAVVRIITILIGNLYKALAHRPRYKFYAIKGIFQMLKLIIIGLGAIVGISILIGRSPVAIITALGASAAILMLVFKDTILGLVASVQLTANNMLHRGDWIATEKHGANGVVVDVSLTTVKVRNWDNTITTVPPYSLVSESFKNYEPMRVSGGRRVERAIYIDANTVRFCTSDELDSLSSEGWLDGLDIDTAKHVVNLRLLRHYLAHYLSTNELVNTEMTHMVRQLDPTPSGLPLQMYFFTRTTAWEEYESVQSDIFDHIYAVIGRFGLRIFQTPAGIDIKELHR